MGRARAAFTHLKNELDREVVNKEMQDLFRAESRRPAPGNRQAESVAQ